jgi:hypothetical protein
MPRPRMASGWCSGILLLLAGCLPRQESTRTAEFLDRVRGWTGIGSAPGIYLQTGLIERPAPDPYLDRELWSAPGVMNPLEPEQTALLELNGFQVRVIRGVPPPRFLEYISSEQSLIQPMLRAAPANTPKVIPINGPLDRVQLRVRPDLKADDSEEEYATVDCGIKVLARPASGGKVTLKCEPQFQHGQRQSWLRPSDDGTKFMRKEQKPLVAYSNFAWETTLGPHDYLLVGMIEDADGTLGQAFFQVTMPHQLRHRVLVIRASRQESPVVAGFPTRTSAAASAVPPTPRPAAPVTARGVSP